ncbi:hypothetical protein PMIT1313_01081 [Prochlorococcus marinus str. MIT 1313]|nr:hypothetical protein PMIT1313_01081 [Prochlorococcus marinus str. MIT 1313]
MIDVTFLGASGYICKNLQLSLTDKCGLSFSSRSESSDQVKGYIKPSDIPFSNIIIDFSCRADGYDICSTDSLASTYFRLAENSSRCNYYFFVSTAAINICKTLKLGYNNYIASKVALENMLFGLNTCKSISSLRLPVVFGDRPKPCTVIEVFYNKIKGFRSKLRDPCSYISAIHISDLIDSINVLRRDIHDNQNYDQSIVLVSESILYNAGKLFDVVTDQYIHKRSLSINCIAKQLEFFTCKLDLNDCRHIAVPDYSLPLQIKKWNSK